MPRMAVKMLLKPLKREHLLGGAQSALELVLFAVEGEFDPVDFCLNITCMLT